MAYSTHNGRISVHPLRTGFGIMFIMYIKLTRANGDPIWINASFIVTIEPNTRSGGSIVVPIGDGLDYEVKESPDTVLSMLDGTIPPAIIPVPTSDALKKKSIPENQPRDLTEITDNKDIENAITVEELVEEPKPAKKSTKRTKAKATKKEETQSESTETATVKKKTATKARTKKKAPLTLDVNELERLRKLAPKTLKKLHNTIATQFKTVDPLKTIESLKEHEIINLDGDHIIWSKPT